MKAKDIFKDEGFIECLKYNTYDNNGKYIKIFNEKNEIIEENVKKVTEINCFNYWIPNIKGISIFRNLKKLYINYCDIKIISEEIGNLINLEVLDLNKNRIENLPKEIENLKNLKN